MVCSIRVAFSILITGIIIFTCGVTQLIAKPFAPCWYHRNCDNTYYYPYTDYCDGLLISGGIFTGIGAIILMTGSILFSQAYKNPVQNHTSTTPMSYPLIQGTSPVTVFPSPLYQNPAPGIYPGQPTAPIHSQPSGYSGTPQALSLNNPCAGGCSHAQAHPQHLPKVETPQI